MQAEIRSQVRKFCEDNGFTNDYSIFDRPQQVELDDYYW